jgi:hypothetical protein
MNHTIIATVAAVVALTVAWTIGAIDHGPIQAYAVSSRTIQDQGTTQAEQIQASVPIRIPGSGSNTRMPNDNTAPDTN